MQYIVEVWVTRSFRNTVEVEANNKISAGKLAEAMTLESSDDNWSYEDVSCHATVVKEVDNERS